MYNLHMRAENLFIDGDAGKIECRIQEPEFPTHAWLVLHPHPLHGGKMNHPVLYHLRNILHDHGGITLSFHFRGVGLSSGAFTGGEGELSDAKTVYEYVKNTWPELPVSILGYSFGAVIGLDLTRSAPSRHLALVGFPLTMTFNYPEKIQAGSLLVFQGEKDEFGTPEQVRKAFDGRGYSAKIFTIPASNHFFHDHFPELISTFTRALFESGDNA